MTTYYVSNTGNDSNDGLAPETAWATVSKVRNFGLLSGDTVLFKRGDTFYGRLWLGATYTLPVTIGAYGVGEKPKISGYKKVNNASSWVQHSANVWKTDLTATGTFTGNRDSWDTNVGFLKLDGTIYGVKRFALAELVAQWEFYSDSQYAYVYSTANPTSLKTDINIAINHGIVDMKNNLIVKDLDIVGTGGHGFSGNPNGMQILNCDIHEIGGSVLVGFGDGKTRYGNGIEFYDGGNNSLVEYNNIYDVYDVAFTMQGSTPTGWFDIVCRQNTIWNCNQAFEIWNATGVNSKYVNCFFEDNICINMGYGWSYDVRPDKNNAVALLLYGIRSNINDIKVRGNSFYNPRTALYYADDTLTNSSIVYQSDKNYIFLREGQKIHYQFNQTVEQSDSFAQSLNAEKNSKFFIIADVAEKIDDIISNILSHTGTTISRLNGLQKTVGRLKSGINEIQNGVISKIRQSNTDLEMPHLNGFIRPVGGYITNLSTTNTDGYAKLATATINISYNRFDMVLSYMICADGTLNRNGVGTVNLQVIPASDKLSAQIDLDVFEIHGLKNGLSAQDFVAVVEKADGTNVVVSLYFNIGKDNYARLAFQPLLVYSDGSDFKFHNNLSLVSSLPSGTQVRPSSENPYINRPLTGTTTPSVTPNYIGQEYIDTTNKIAYKACGLAASDWKQTTN